MKRVLLDVDGVLADFIGSVCRSLQVIGRQHKPEDVTEFDFCKSLGLDSETARRIKSVISEGDHWWPSLEVFPGAVDGVRALRQVAEVFIVTSPWNSNRTWLHAREAWLKCHFDIPHSHVIACSAKHIVRGDILIDDKTDTLVRWQAEHPDGVAVQWQTPHNRRDGWWGPSTRSWDDILALVRVERAA